MYMYMPLYIWKYNSNRKVENHVWFGKKITYFVFVSCFHQYLEKCYLVLSLQEMLKTTIFFRQIKTTISETKKQNENKMAFL